MPPQPTRPAWEQEMIDLGIPSDVQCRAWPDHKRVLMHSVDRLLMPDEARALARQLARSADEIDGFDLGDRYIIQAEYDR